MNLRTAITQHLQWKHRLALLVAGEDRSVPDPELVALPDQCELGGWLQGEGQRVFGSHPTFLDLQETHAAFHRTSAQVLRLVAEGRWLEAERAFDWDFRPVYAESMRSLLRLRDLLEPQAA